MRVEPLQFVDPNGLEGEGFFTTLGYKADDGQHLIDSFEGVDWDSFGDNFDDAWNEWAKSKLRGDCP